VCSYTKSLVITPHWFSGFRRPSQGDGSRVLGMLPVDTWAHEVD